MKRLLQLTIAVVLLLPMAAGGQTTSITVTYTWTPPTTGSAVHHYDLQLSPASPVLWNTLVQTVTAPTASVALPVGTTWIFRVRGVDALGRSGLWSDPAEAYTPDAGAPGACGKPIRVP